MEISIPLSYNGELMYDFRVHRHPTWGTCAGLILLSESANRTKKGGQELIGGLDVRVNRNHFGRQTESFEAELDLPFLRNNSEDTKFRSVFIRAPVVEKILPHVSGIQVDEEKRDSTIVAPSKTPKDEVAKQALSKEVEVMARLPRRGGTMDGDQGDIIAIRQGNCFGTSFHPELTGDARIHVWWLNEVLEAVKRRRVVS